jgi:predicted metal-dependent HD superfamily phosphohydrolase
VLRARYAEPHRRYHGVRHLETVLDNIDLLAAEAESPDVVRLAAWFHDAVYDPQRRDNEEVSAQLAEGLLPTFKISDDDIVEVARLVRLTATHAPEAGDRNGAVLCDADLAVLASKANAYMDYAVNVRMEYTFLDDKTFARGRLGVLRSLASRDHLFMTRRGRERWESPARANLKREIMLLEAIIG